MGRSRRAASRPPVRALTAHGDSVDLGPWRKSELPQAGSAAAQPDQTAVRLRRALRSTRRRRLVASGVVICPLISGLFFGLVATSLVLRSDEGRAGEIGALVGGAVFALTAVALCLVHVSARAETGPEMPSPVRHLHTSR